MLTTALKRLALPRLTDRLALGSEGLRVSPFGLGMVVDRATVPAAFDTGVNFFFVSADMHWPLYENTRRGLAELLARRGGIRDDMVVAGVCYPTQPEFGTAPFQELVDSVPGLKGLDVLLAGGVYGGEFRARRAVFEEHRQSGFLGNRAVGATFHDRPAARMAMRKRDVEIAFIRYNPGHAGARRDVFPDLDLP